VLDQNFKNENGSAKLMIAPWQLDKQGNPTLKKVTLLLTVGGKDQAPQVRFINRDKDKVAQ
jgi:hypothetical protein